MGIRTEETETNPQPVVTAWATKDTRERGTRGFVRDEDDNGGRRIPTSWIHNVLLVKVTHVILDIRGQAEDLHAATE